MGCSPCEKAARQFSKKAFPLGKRGRDTCTVPVGKGLPQNLNCATISKLRSCVARVEKTACPSVDPWQVCKESVLG